MDIIGAIKTDRELVVDKSSAQTNNPIATETAAVVTSQTGTQGSNVASGSAVGQVNNQKQSIADVEQRFAQAKSQGKSSSVAQEGQSASSPKIFNPLEEDESSIIEKMFSLFDSDKSKMLREIEQQQEAERSAEAESQRKEALARAKEEIAALNQKQVRLRFDTDNDFDDTDVVNVVDASSNEVIRQIPSDEFLRVVAAVREYEQRIEQADMSTDPQVKAKGFSSLAEKDSLRGAMFDDLV